MKVVLLYKGNMIAAVLKVATNNYWAKEYVKENHPEFYKDTCQYSKYDSDEFIRIENAPL